jgi:hypothetical protein
MNIKNLALSILGVGAILIPLFAQTPSAPIIDPAGTGTPPSVIVCVDPTTNQFFKASGGVAPYPTEPTSFPPWVPVTHTNTSNPLGKPVYIWTYDGNIVGTPASGQESADPLKMNRDVPGKSTIKVKLKQDWVDSTTKVITETSTRSPDSATVDFIVAKIDLHPIEADFSTGKVSRLMISTKQDDVYYTVVKTTKDNKVAQTEDAKVKITAHIQPTNMVGKTIYFRVVDPDPDDASPYETGAAKGDNRETVDKAGKLSSDRDVAELKTINNVEVVAAEVELKITNRYAGDNYQVEASLDSTFSNICAKTAILVAWKRCYLERDNMYKKGGTLTTAYTPPTDNKITEVDLMLDNATDFAAGKLITIFSPTATHDTTVIRKVGRKIFVATVPNAFPKYSGVKLRDNNDSFNLSLTYLEQAYGRDTDGSDGGTFVEYTRLPAGSGNIPKYTSFPNDLEAKTFCEFWFSGSASKENLFQVVAANKHNDGSFGTTDRNRNISYVTIGGATSTNNAVAQVEESAVHEIAHQFFEKHGHVDKPIETPNHEGSDGCVMSYRRIRDNGIAEFDTICIYDIRDAVDPQ